ncbi:MATE family efflux transporter [Neptunomonas phycophila]|nr:MATE family efflux transporter [Neptunomonas phycophila]
MDACHQHIWHFLLHLRLSDSFVKKLLFINELRYLFALGLPIMLTQIAQSSLGFVDTIIAGQHSTQSLAAVALGTSLWFPLFLTFTGVLMATTPLVAHSVGEKRRDKTPGLVQQAFWIALILGIVSVLLLRSASPLFDLMRVEPDLTKETLAYLKAVSFGLPAMFIYQVIRCYCDGISQTRPALIISITALLLNIPLNIIFVFGYFGLPELGGEGCGWATAIVMWFMLFSGIFLLKTSHPLKLPKVEKRRLWVPGVTKQLLMLGLPIGASIMIETSMFSVIALALAPLGTTIVAAHQITLSFTSQVFMIPLSIAMASTIRIGTLMGAKQAEKAWIVARIALCTAATLAIFTSIGVWLFAWNIADIFSNELPVIELATSLLIISAFFEISDALQVTTAGALRGYKDTKIPLIIVCFAYWGIGLPLGYILGMTDLITPSMGAAGFWYALVIALSISAGLLIIRIRSVARNAIA